MPDRLFLRYQPGRACSDEYPVAAVLWIEFKRPGAKPRPEQLAWHEAERKRGALVKVVDDISEFCGWYRNSGLARNCK